jgi:integrase
MVFAIYIGCWQSELFSLEWSDIVFERRQIIIQNKEDRKNVRKSHEVRRH